MSASWPDIPYPAWRETCSALHLYTQIVGKYRLARTPWVNHSWHATLYVNARGLTTLADPGRSGSDRDRVRSRRRMQVIGTASDGSRASMPLGPMSVAEFHARFIEMIASLGGTPEFHDRPNEVPNPVPFREDRQTRPYDAEAVTRFFQALVAIDRVFQRFRTGFIGKVSPVHLFWGSFDLAVTRFSGRPRAAPPRRHSGPARRGDARGLQPRGLVRRVLAGRRRNRFPGVLLLCLSRAERLCRAPIPAPQGAYFDRTLGEFLLPYDAVRQSADPEATLLAFLDSTYRAAADLGSWDRAALEAPLGVPLRPRPVSPS